MATQSNVCSICHEHFRAPEFARRCEAQGRPPLIYHVGDVLFDNPTCLRVVSKVSVHHGTGKCPIDGPCEHAISYIAYRLYPTHFGLPRAWLASAGNAEQIPGPFIDPNTRVMTLTTDWGVIPEDGHPANYLAGPRPEEDWRRLWELWDAMQPKKVGRPRKNRQLLMLKKEE